MSGTAAPLFLESSAILQVVLEQAVSDLPWRVGAAPALLASRLALVECSRALHRLRAGGTAELGLARAELDLEDLWARTTIIELSPEVCVEASRLAPASALRTLDALHLASFLLCRRDLPDLELVTADHRLAAAAGVA